MYRRRMSHHTQEGRRLSGAQEIRRPSLGGVQEGRPRGRRNGLGNILVGLTEDDLQFLQEQAQVTD